MPKLPGKLPAVVLCHGNYREGKDALFMHMISDKLAENGFIVICFDNLCFNKGWRPKNGVIESPEEIDLRWAAYAAVTYISSRMEADASKIILVGHSMGATVALAVGSTDDRVLAVAAISPTHVARFIFDGQKLDSFWHTNILARMNATMDKNTTKIMRYVTLEENYISLLRMKNVLFIYGKVEIYMDYNNWIEKYAVSVGNTASIVGIDGAGHYFGVSPDKENRSAFNRMADELLNWLDSIVNGCKPDAVNAYL